LWNSYVLTWFRLKNIPPRKTLQCDYIKGVIIMCFIFCYTSILLIVQKLACFVFCFLACDISWWPQESSQLHHFLVFIKHASSWHLTFNFFIVFMFNETFFTWTLFTSFFFFFCCFLGMCFFVLQCCEGFVLVSTNDHYLSLSRACSFVIKMITMRKKSLNIWMPSLGTSQ